MQAFDYASGLRTLDLGPGMIDIFHRQVQLLLVRVGTAAVLRASIGQDAAEQDFVRITEGHHLVIEEIGGRQRRLAVVELGKGYLGVGINEGLLVNPAYAL